MWRRASDFDNSSPTSFRFTFRLPIIDSSSTWCWRNVTLVPYWMIAYPWEEGTKYVARFRARAPVVIPLFAWRQNHIRSSYGFGLLVKHL